MQHGPPAVSFLNHLLFQAFVEEVEVEEVKKNKKKTSLEIVNSFKSSPHKLSISNTISCFCLLLPFSSIAGGHLILALAQNGTDLTQI